ncbi:hypothetical protein AVEN_29040-1 [Araneus ventricosus]|uniref:Integrase zinc-binding domain-containing protein n=1 Tax=Araneus ventricosus TaxID=182803 RepID=A0A4Y2AJH8_ARAVE|nr:hypothetical protein AVEN_29040-1 [Araneus ventricosus]
MYLADTLSRTYVQDTIKDYPEMMYIVHSISKHLPMSENRINQFKQETKAVSYLQIVLKYIKEGWLVSLKNVPNIVKPYFKAQNDLHTNEGLIFLGDKIVVPYTLRRNMLQLIHEAHFGMEKCKKRARELMYGQA